MGLYEGIKDAVSLAQKADNIELYQKLIDLSKQALDMQEEINQLKSENRELKTIEDVEQKIVRYGDKTLISLKDDPNELIYCSICWDKDRRLIQVPKKEIGTFYCNVCKNNGEYDSNLYKRCTSNNHSSGFPFNDY